MEQIETEVKFHVADTGELHERLLACGAVPRETVFETNLRFDDAGQSLLAARQLLRLRRDNRAVLTFKQAPDRHNAARATDFKMYNEIETVVDDFEAARKILGALGFQEVQRYEKQRRTYVVDDTELCLDTMPYGVFLEIEGDKAAIRRLADCLGLSWERRILANYLEMFEHIKETASLPFSDVTFDNFKRVTVDIPDLLHKFEAVNT
ncbi:MAG: class IV adenylate cyclase [Desulfosudaceae bacterium]